MGSSYSTNTANSTSLSTSSASTNTSSSLSTNTNLSLANTSPSPPSTNLTNTSPPSPPSYFELSKNNTSSIRTLFDIYATRYQRQFINKMCQRQSIIPPFMDKRMYFQYNEKYNLTKINYALVTYLSMMLLSKVNNKVINTPAGYQLRNLLYKLCCSINMRGKSSKITRNVMSPCNTGIIN